MKMQVLVSDFQIDHSAPVLLVLISHNARIESASAVNAEVVVSAGAPNI